MGLEALFGLVAFGTLGFLWAILPNTKLKTEAK